MTKFTDDVLHGMIRDATGIDVSDDEYLAFSDVEQSVRDDVARLRDVKTFPEGVTVIGLVYDVRTGALTELGDVAADRAASSPRGRPCAPAPPP